MTTIRLKHEALAIVQALFGFVVVGLVMVGIAGTIYLLIAPEGWLTRAFGRSASAGLTAVGALLAVLALAWFSRGRSAVQRSRLSDLAVFGFAAAGLVYLLQLWQAL